MDTSSTSGQLCLFFYEKFHTESGKWYLLLISQWILVALPQTGNKQGTPDLEMAGKSRQPRCDLVYFYKQMTQDFLLSVCILHILPLCSPYLDKPFKVIVSFCLALLLQTKNQFLSEEDRPRDSITGVTRFSKENPGKSL